jgi:hypothetical protein
MCATFFFNKKDITSVGELEEILQAPVQTVLEQDAPIDWSPGKGCCLCYVDPLAVALRLDKLVLCDLTQAFYTFKDRND